MPSTAIETDEPIDTADADADWRARLTAFVAARRQALSIWIRDRKRRKAAKGGSKRFNTWLLLLLVLLFTTFGLLLGRVFNTATPGTKLSLDELQGRAKSNAVLSATFRNEDNRVVGTMITPEGPTASYYADYSPNTTITAEVYKALQADGARIVVDPQTSKQVERLLATYLLPLLILATVFAILLAPGGRGGGGLGDVTDFSQMKNARGAGKKNSLVTFEDAGGVDEAVVELREVVDYLKNPAKYEALGAAPPKGLLFFGPPGCGKTLLAKAVAGEAEVPFFSVAGAEFVEALVGVGAARVRDLFARVRAAAPAIVFIDELDAAGRKRGAGGTSGGADEREQTLNQLLVEMDGFDVSRGIVIMGATNRPDILDPALRRPGRFDRHITIERPDGVGRERILRIHARGKRFASDVDWRDIADRTPGFTGADLANVANEAALLAIRELRGEITVADVVEAIRRVLEGPKRRGHLMSVEERRRASYHEAGHVLLSLETKQMQSVHRVSILTRGKTIATTELRTEEEELLMTESQLRLRLATTLGGAAAERLVFGEISTGVERDLEEATALARDMVARFGMNDAVGLVRLFGPDANAFLGDDTPLADIAPETKATIDAAVRQLIAEAELEARLVLEHHRPLLDGFAATLAEVETLEGDPLQRHLDDLRAKMSPVAARRARANGTTPRRRRNPSATAR